jgi:hypothetical protein
MVWNYILFNNQEIKIVDFINFKKAFEKDNESSSRIYNKD